MREGEKYLVQIFDAGSEILKSVKNVLEKNHYTVITSKTYTLELSVNIDLFILDISDLNGKKICSKLKSNKNTKDIPILLIANKEDTACYEKMIEYGANDFMSFSVNQLELLHRVNVQIDLYDTKKKYIKASDLLDDYKNNKSAEKNRFRSIVDKSVAGYFFIDNDGIIQEVNDSWVKMYKYDTKEEVVGKHFAVIQKIDDLSLANQFVDGIMKGKVEYMSGDFSRKCKDESIGYHTFSARPVIISASIIGIEGFIIDTTERKLMEIKIVDSEKRYRNLLKNLNAGIIVHSSDTSVIYCNQHAHSLLGLSEKQMLGKEVIDPVWQFFRDDGKPLSLRQYPVSQVIRTRMKLHNLVLGINRPQTNGLLWALVNGFPVFDDNGDIDQVIISFINITQRKNNEYALLKAKEEAERREKHIKKQNIEYEIVNEELTEKNSEFEALNEEQKEHIEEFEVLNEELTDSYDQVNRVNEELRYAKEKAVESDRLKSAFLANMSHEIRTPLNGIMGFADMLQDTDKTNEQLRKYGKIINKSSNQLLHIVNDILDISKIDAGQLIISNVEYSVNVLMDDLYELYQNKKEQKHSAIELRMNQGLSYADSYVLIDEFRLKQILSNLLNNSMKFTPSGYVEFGYILKDNMLEFYVKDTGIGIDKDNRNLIFKRFTQAEETTTRKYGGTGLGLAIVKGLVELMAGEITFKSIYGEGTTFYFTIPYNVMKSTQDSKIEIEEIEEYYWSDKRILVVEDDPTSIEFITELLKPTNAILFFAETGLDAIEKCIDTYLDLVLMDIQLPDINGYEATKAIKKIKDRLPIIAQTAYALPEDRAKSYEAGCDDFIAKPLKKLELLKLIDKYF